MDEDRESLIESCRAQISEIDRQIFSLVKKREGLSAKIGEAKRGLKIADRDFNREKLVFEQAATLAKELDLPVSFATSLQKLIIEASVSRQEKDRIKNNFHDAPKSVLVVGGAGRLGSWLCRFFADSGHGVSVADVVKPNFDCRYFDRIDARAMQHDLVVVATPMRTSLGIFKQFEAFDLSKPVIFDTSSVKSPIRDGLLRLKDLGAKVTSLHPMFGPSVELLFGKHIIRTSLGVEAADREASDLFRATSLTVVDMSIEEHDEMIAMLLSLSHMLNLIFVRALRSSPFPIALLERFSSPTFSNLLAIAKQVHSENPHLYYEIQALNPYTKKALRHVSDALSAFNLAVELEDEDQFVSMMKDGQIYLLGQKGD